ncbi:MAG: rod shape-determining protein MreD [Actinomycetota bacterium]|nr:rod shape-determining protein MreD [Actinomycetota bacterium]
MTRSRAIAAITSMLTAMLLQATLVAPLTLPAPVSLPALTVAAIALVDGPGSGMAYGFAAGLVADLASLHPAGVLALCWLAVGLVCGLAANRGTVRRDAAVAAVVCAVGAAFATLLLTVLHADGATASRAASTSIPTLVGDALLALAVVPITRAFLHTGSLRGSRASEPTSLLGAHR